MAVSRWITNLVKGFGIRSSLSAEATVPSDVAWSNFLSSEPMNTILTARHTRHLPKTKEVWADLCQTACKLWMDLDEEGLIDYIPTAYPTICMVIKGKYYFQLYPREARRLMFEEEPYTNLVRAMAACSCCPYSFATRLLGTQAHQLMISDYAGHQTPLHVLCGQEVKRDDDKEPLIALFVKSCTKAASEIDKEGLYPLHRACKAKYTWSTGIQDLVKAAPQIATLERDGKTPFVMSALAHAKKKDTNNRRQPSPHSSDQEEEAKIDVEVTETLFELLRLDPTAIMDL